MALGLFWNDGFAPVAATPLASYVADAALAAQNTASEARQDSRDTDERLDQLLLVCAAMWELLREKTGLTEADLVERIAIIDARDGRADGKMLTAPRKCPKCNRTVFPRHQRCLYCGADVPVDTVFKTV